jgi:hypothetical protein
VKRIVRPSLRRFAFIFVAGGSSVSRLGHKPNHANV